MKPSIIMVLFRTIILVLLVTLVKSDDNTTDPTYDDESLKELVGQAIMTSGNVALIVRQRKLGKYSAVFAGVAIVGGDMQVLSSQFTAEAPYETSIKTIDGQLKRLEEGADDVLNQVSELKAALNDEIDRASHAATTENRLTHLDKFINKIKNAPEDLSRLTSSYTEKLAENLLKFIWSFDGGKYGSHIVSILNGHLIMLKPLVDDLIIRGRNQYQGTRWSTSTMIYNLHATVLRYLIEENSVLEDAYTSLSRVTGTHIEGDFRKLAIDKSNTILQFQTDYRNTYQKLTNDDCVQQLKLAILEENKIVSLKFLLQQIWMRRLPVRESLIGARIDCEEVWDMHNPRSFCFGGLIKCVVGGSTGACGKDVIYQRPPVDATYSAVGSDGVYEWLRHYAPHVIPPGFPTCDVPNTYPRWQKIGKFRGFGSEELCACVCDQYRFKSTTRRFYVKVIAAPSGHVITGVRFVEENHAIFLQIQSGELLPKGIVNENVEWQPLPNNTKPEDYIALDYWKRSVVLNSLNAPKKDEFITAISFEPHELGVRFRTYKRKVNSFANGTLWHKLRKTPVHRIKISREEVREFWDLIPTLSAERILMKVTKPLAVKFGMSSWADYKQTCIPYFDGSDVEFGIKVPLTDIRFVHYTNHAEYAGYIRPLLTSIDYNYFCFLE